MLGVEGQYDIGRTEAQLEIVRRSRAQLRVRAQVDSHGRSAALAEAVALLVLLLVVRRVGRGVGARVVCAGGADAAVVRGALMGVRTSDLGEGEGRQEQQSQESDRGAASHY